MWYLTNRCSFIYLHTVVTSDRWKFVSGVLESGSVTVMVKMATLSGCMNSSILISYRLWLNSGGSFTLSTVIVHVTVKLAKLLFTVAVN